MRSGAAVGDGAAAGTITTSPSITTIISTGPRTLMAAIATTLVQEIARRSCRIAARWEEAIGAALREAAEMPVGNTIPNIAVALPIGTEPRLTSLGGPHVENRLVIAKLAPGNSLDGKAEILPAIGAGAAPSAEMVQGADSAVAGIGLAAGISRVEEEEIGMLLEEGPEDHVGITGRALGRAETEAHRA